MENDYSKFNSLLNGMPLDELKKNGGEELKKNEEDFKALKEALAQNMCSMCGQKIDSFIESEPCFHWLLWQSKDLDKRHFDKIIMKKGFHQLDAYLRWVANSDSPIKNINDLIEENPPKTFIGHTIKYKNLEWSFSCSDNDLGGHHGRHEGKYPHFHFQMKINGNVVIRYGDFHAPFNDYDDFCFAVKRGEFDKLRHKHIQGAGMQTVIDEMDPELLLNQLQRTDEIDNSEFNMDSFITADTGTTISGDTLADLMAESKKTGVPMAKLLRKLPNVSIQTYISPGPGVPEIAIRSPKRKKNKISKN